MFQNPTLPGFGDWRKKLANVYNNALWQNRQSPCSCVVEFLARWFATKIVPCAKGGMGSLSLCEKRACELRTRVLFDSFD